MRIEQQESVKRCASRGIAPRGLRQRWTNNLDSRIADHEALRDPREEVLTHLWRASHLRTVL
jgi:hypothetical protein